VFTAKGIVPVEVFCGLCGVAVTYFFEERRMERRMERWMKK